MAHHVHRLKKMGPCVLISGSWYKIAGEHRIWLIERCRTSAFTLRGLVAELADRGLKVDYHSVWDFVHAEGLSFKKNTARQRAGSFRRGTAARAMAQVSGAD